MTRPTLLRHRGISVEAWAPLPGEAELAFAAVAPGADETLALPPVHEPTTAGLRVRKNQRALTADEWAAYINAIDAVAGDDASAPTYHDMVDVHRRAMETGEGMAWGVHTMDMGATVSEGRNFLAWHRQYLLRLEDRLRQVDPSVTVPYWNWVEDPAVPRPLDDPDDLRDWNITREVGRPGTALPTADSVNPLFNLSVTSDFRSFSQALENGPHNAVHRWVGGTMADSTSPADPLFWIHHAFVDRLWLQWQTANHGAKFDPPNQTETLQPPPLMTGTVDEQLDVEQLGYTYT